ncbi:zonular occludens toxin family protein [Acinetobacter baumannii]|uniref:zonular occludens toxin domain-containing protein n=1 Tax=Acinetobacter baumannii TaxID=470 RepID=UPI00066DC5A4|nr:zonular occludens toxin domain-containing protein [Acinetobacter baumannii]KMV07591.1 zonular occludens toxin family protein [Acinetobacter baumannii]
MLYAIVAKPGQGKSYFAVVRMYEEQQKNLENLKKNAAIFDENRKLLEERDLLERDFTYNYEIGNQKFEKTSNYEYFDCLEDAEQFPEYFEYYFFYNKYIEQITKDEGIALTALLPVRQIYSNINGLKIQGVLPFPSLDWRKTPMGSIHYIDEIRDHPPYNWDGRKVCEDPIIKEMSKVRHTDKDVWLITQDAEDFNYSLRQLIDKLYFVKRPPQNPQACGIYVFDKYFSRPRDAADSLRDPKKYVDYFLLVYKKKYQRMYVSASSHTSMKFRIPPKVFFYSLLFIAIFTIAIVGFMKIPIFQSFGSAIKQMTGQEKDAFSQLKAGPQATPNPSETIADKLKREAECGTLTPEQCADLKHPEVRNNQLQQVNDVRMETIAVKYNPNRPYEMDTSKIEYQVTSKPVFAGCMKKNGRYVAYTEQGTILHDVSQSDCRKLIEDNDRPYNYFKQQSQGFAQPQQAQQLPQQPQEVDYPSRYKEAEIIAKYEAAKQQGLI